MGQLLFYDMLSQQELRGLSIQHILLPILAYSVTTITQNGDWPTS